MPQPRIILPAHVIKSLRDAGAPEAEGVIIDPRQRPEYPHLSFSQVSMYLRCSMQYFFKYVAKAPDQKKVSLAIGSGGHAAIEKATKRKIRNGVTVSPQEVTDWASDFMDKELAEVPLSEIEKDMEPGEAKDKFIAATRVYQTRDAPKIKPIGAEVEFLLDLNEFRPEDAEPMRPVYGKIDNVNEDSDTMIVHEQRRIKVEVSDSKFVTRKRSQNEVNLSPQLSLYATVLKKVTGAWPTRLGYRQFHPGNTKDGPDSIPLLREAQYMTGEALDARMRRIAFQFARVEEGIRKGIFIPTDDPITCSWCPFRQRCQDSLVDDFEAAAIREKMTVANP